MSCLVVLKQDKKTSKIWFKLVSTGAHAFQKEEKTRKVQCT